MMIGGPDACPTIAAVEVGLVVLRMPAGGILGDCFTSGSVSEIISV
jgi:hypothetical protein